MVGTSGCASTSCPIAATTTGPLAAETAAELTAPERSYRGRAKREQVRFQDATDSEYWFAVCVHSRAEKEAFLRKHNLEQLGDKYLPGREVDRLLSQF